jgi:hypothetical protein
MFLHVLVEASVSNFAGIARQKYNHLWNKDSVDE